MLLEGSWWLYDLDEHFMVRITLLWKPRGWMKISFWVLQRYLNYMGRENSIGKNYMGLENVLQIVAQFLLDPIGCSFDATEERFFFDLNKTVQYSKS